MSTHNILPSTDPNEHGRRRGEIDPDQLVLNRAELVRRAAITADDSLRGHMQNNELFQSRYPVGPAAVESVLQANSQNDLAATHYNNVHNIDKLRQEAGQEASSGNSAYLDYLSEEVERAA